MSLLVITDCWLSFSNSLQQPTNLPFHQPGRKGFSMVKSVASSPQGTARFFTGVDVSQPLAGWPCPPAFHHPTQRPERQWRKHRRRPRHSTCSLVHSKISRSAYPWDIQHSWCFASMNKCLPKGVLVIIHHDWPSTLLDIINSDSLSMIKHQRFHYKWL